MIDVSHVPCWGPRRLEQKEMAPFQSVSAPLSPAAGTTVLIQLYKYYMSIELIFSRNSVQD